MVIVVVYAVLASKVKVAVCSILRSFSSFAQSVFQMRKTSFVFALKFQAQLSTKTKIFSH